MRPFSQTVKWMQALIDRVASSPTPSFLQWLRLQNGDGGQLAAAQEILSFQARDTYTAVITPYGESLIGKSIRELASALGPDCFCQIHRSTIVDLSQIAKMNRSLTGRGVIRLKPRSETLSVSRAYLHLFKQM